MSKPSNPQRPPTAAFATLLGSAAALTGLAVYQWLELLEVRAGRPVACAVNATINCAKVWDSAISHRIHEYLGLPVAALGVLWGAVGMVLAGLWWQRVKATGDGSTFSGAVKLWAIAGLLACVSFITASIQAQALCLTCLGTYVLTAAYGVGALKLMGGPAIPEGKELMSGAGWAMVMTVPLYLVLLYPGSKTPQHSKPSVPVVESGNPNDFAKIVASMPEQERLSAAWARAEWLKSPTPDVSMFPRRLVRGNPNAPVKLVEFSDILCGHCAQFEFLFHEIEGMSPPNGLSYEPRYYPLDGECNPDIQRTKGDGVRCYGARLQICAEKNPRFFELRKELFQNQERLDKGMMLAIATRYGIDAQALDACMKSEDTKARLLEDIAYARTFKIEGTPLVILNGKVAPPAPIFLLGMVLSGGDANSPVLSSLPPPPKD